MQDWTEWLPFPDPRKKGILHAPFGPGVYEVRCADTKKYVLFGKGKNCAHRMTSLLPAPLGQGTRNNKEKREYVLEHLERLEYRCCACADVNEAGRIEAQIRNERQFRFAI